jgi:nucleotide-binding universal stress UspA family protein
MAKILVALNDNETFNANLFKLAEELFADISRQLFVGLLVKDVSYITSLGTYLGEPVLADFLPYQSELLTEEDEKKAEVISKFERSAKDTCIRYEICNNYKMTIQEVVKQSTYADLLILSYRIFYNFSSNKPDTTLLYQILKGSKCPVLIMPQGMDRIDNIILTYDGKESSVFAIKAFSNLFASQMKDKIVSILTVTPSAEEEIKNEKLLLDMSKQHFNNVGIQLLEGHNISKEINKFASGQKNPLVVMGAYGRSHISNLLIPSVARNILKTSRIPLFIAHR